MNDLLDNVFSLSEHREKREEAHQYEQAVLAGHPSAQDPKDCA